MPPKNPAKTLSVLVLPQTVLFPRLSLSMFLFEDREVALLEDLVHPAHAESSARGGGEELVVSLCQWDSPYPQEARPNPVGCRAELVRWERQDIDYRIWVRGIERVQIGAAHKSDPFLVAAIEPLGAPAAWRRPRSVRHTRDLVAQVRTRAQEMAFSREEPQARELLNTLEWLDDPGALADYAAHHFVGDWYLKQELLEMVDPVERLEALLDVIGAPAAGA